MTVLNGICAIVDCLGRSPRIDRTFTRGARGVRRRTLITAKGFESMSRLATSIVATRKTNAREIVLEGGPRIARGDDTNVAVRPD